MDQPRKTGLGGSLLLQRTEPSGTPERPDVSPPPASLNAPADASVPQTSQRSKRSERSNVQQSTLRGKDEPQVLRDRCTLYIDREVNERLDLVARVEGRERSEVVSQLLRKHLPKYRIETED